MPSNWFQDARYGLFIHFGLYSMLGRGEWVLNKEQIPIDEYKTLADDFDPEKFDADWLLGKARQWGMKYAILTTKHHDGFCLYDSKLSDFTAPKTNCGRDLVREFVEACRKHDLKVGLYHTLNDWTATPDAVDALERPDECHGPFIDFVHGQIREIMTGYGKVDIMWYDGWWPFNAEGWRAEKLNAMVRDLQPGILVNGRTGLAGDFATPEGHISAGSGMWEACMTLNDHWGYHHGDDNWKSPRTVAGMLQKVAAGAGNLLLNVGPRGDGSIPERSVHVLDAVGQWLDDNGEAVYGSERFEFNLRERRPGDRSDFTAHGRFTARGNAMYLHVTSWPGEKLAITGLECTVTGVSHLASGQSYAFEQNGGKIVVTLPETMDTSVPVVLKFETSDTPSLYRTGGYRNPTVPHCRYDPVPSDIAE
jgi:alpha-L-fucosidase